MTIQEEKRSLRQKIACLKKNCSPLELEIRSAEALKQLEKTDLFRQAGCIALYHALPGEVQTAAFIEKWYRKKEIALPVIEGNDLRLVLYRGPGLVRAGLFGITEPDLCCPEISIREVNCLIVPGIAFDRCGNRLGRGKGYYDRLLHPATAPKVGLAFHFQLVEQVPVEGFDRKMDCVVTDREVV